MKPAPVVPPAASSDDDKARVAEKQIIEKEKQKLCWSSDSGAVEDEYMKDVWIANFAKGRVVLYMLEDRLQLIGEYMETYYVRGVRSAK